jgi:hypothetical protein
VPDLTLLIAIASGLVGLLCLWLTIIAVLRARRIARGAPGAKITRGAPGAKISSGPIETPKELYGFAGKQFLSAIVMFALAVIIYIYS